MVNFSYTEEPLAPCSPGQYRGKYDFICYNCTDKCSTLNELNEEQRQICTLICAESTTLFTTEKTPLTIHWFIPIIAIGIIILVVGAILLFLHLNKKDNGDSSLYKEQEKLITKSKTVPVMVPPIPNSNPESYSPRPMAEDPFQSIPGPDANEVSSLNEERELSVSNRDSLSNEEQETLLEPSNTQEPVHIPDNEPPNNPENNSDPFESMHGPEDSEEDSSFFQPIAEGNVACDVDAEETESGPVTSTGVGNLDELRKANKSSC